MQFRAGMQLRIVSIQQYHEIRLVILNACESDALARDLKSCVEFVIGHKDREMMMLLIFRTCCINAFSMALHCGTVFFRQRRPARDTDFLRKGLGFRV